MISRQRIIEAAARVYASAGFRGTTTRRIAEEAGVNEVTLFRLFGSKAALLAETMRMQEIIDPKFNVPDETLPPLAQITRCNATVLEKLIANRQLIRQGMAEQDERPELCLVLCEEKKQAYERFVSYARDLVRREGTDPHVDVRTAASMLFSAVFQQAMSRDITPETFPPPEQAAQRYARVFLRAIGVPAKGKEPKRRARRRRAHAPAKT